VIVSFHAPISMTAASRPKRTENERLQLCGAIAVGCGKCRFRCFMLVLLSSSRVSADMVVPTIFLMLSL
jgi:hypothetical protein